MDADVWVRRAAMAAVPVIALAIWLSRRPPQPAAAAASASAAAAVPAAPAPPAAGDVVPGGEKALAARDREPEADPAPAHAAVDLPLATAPVLPASRGSAPHRNTLEQTHHEQHAASLCGGLEVRLITASDDPAWSFASIATGDDDPARIRRIGDRVGNWRVAAIDWDRVWVEGGGTRCAVGMHVGAREAHDAARGKSDELLVPAAAEPWSVPEDIASAIDKESETEFAVTRAALDRIFAHATDLLGGVQIVPVKRDEAVVGIRLATLPQDSLLDRLGVERDDVVLALNDAPCTTLSGTLAALGQARDKSELVARLERDGQAFDLSVRVR